MTKAERFCKLNGIQKEHQWIYTTESKKTVKCLRCGYTCDCDIEVEHGCPANPTFTEAKSILEVMMKRKDWYITDNKYAGFIHKIGLNGYIDDKEKPKLFWIDSRYILNPDKLLDEAIKFCEEATQ